MSLLLKKKRLPKGAKSVQGKKNYIDLKFETSGKFKLAKSHEKMSFHVIDSTFIVTDCTIVTTVMHIVL